MCPKKNRTLKQRSKKVEDQGCAIKTFEDNEGQCCEVYGKKDGKNVEHWFNPETGAQVTQ